MKASFNSLRPRTIDLFTADGLILSFFARKAQLNPSSRAAM